MRFLSTLLVTIMLIAFASSAAADVKGIGIAASFSDADFGVQARKDFWLGGDISQITAQGGIYFQNKTTFRLDADYHFIVNPDNPSRLYPLAGVNLSFNSNLIHFQLSFSRIQQL